MDWLPVSAAALVTGGTALFLGAQMIPRPPGEGDLVALAGTHSDRFVILAVLLTVAAVGLIVGMPSLFTLFQRVAYRTGLLAAVLLSVGSVMLASFAQVLIVFRGLAVNGAVSADVVEAVAQDDLQQSMLVGGFLVFFAGELLLALALLRARTTPAWVPWAFVLHVALTPVSQAVVPEGWRGAAAIFVVAGFAGTGVAANRQGRI
jgi:hypothetical protein